MLQSLLTWLRRFGGLGSFAASVVTLLASNWILAVTIVLGVWAAASSWATQFVQKPSTHVFVIVFLAGLWTWIGILYLADRRKPRSVLTAQDYRYGLTFEAILPLFNPKQEDAALAFGLILRNYSSGPIRCDVTNMEVRIGTRSLPRLKKGVLYGYMPRGGSRTSTGQTFSKNDIAEFIGKQAKGVVEISIEYGHPERPATRRLDMVLDVYLELPVNAETTPTGFNSNILSESDVDVPAQ